MAHVGKTYPFMFHRDYSPPSSGFRLRLPWRYKALGLVGPPGPFAGWANKTVIGDVATVMPGNIGFEWMFSAPHGADPTTSIRLRYQLTQTATWYVMATEMLIGGAVAVRATTGPFGTAINEIAVGPPYTVYSPPWPPFTPIMSGFVRFFAATWADLGVSEYPGYPLF